LENESRRITILKEPLNFGLSPYDNYNKDMEIKQALIFGIGVVEWIVQEFVKLNPNPCVLTNLLFHP
jgi:hypothetical protein